LNGFDNPCGGVVSHRESKLEGYGRFLAGTVVILTALWIFFGESFMVNVLEPLGFVIIISGVLVCLTSLLLWIMLGSDRMFLFIEKLNWPWWVAYSVAVLSIPIYWFFVMRSNY
jgi:hypothetical protein